jgi:hypothetical protein
VFKVEPAKAADLVVRMGSYPGAFPLREDVPRWSAYVRDAILEPAIGRDILALAAVRRPALLRQVFGVAASSPAQIVSLQKIQGLLQDAGALETVAHYLALLEESAGRHKWAFTARFRRQAFGWRSQPAIQRVKEAVSEIKGVAREDPTLAADGAVAFIERISPALENIDSSSGAIGTAVNHAIRELVAIIGSAPSDAKTRDAWLERLWEAHEADSIPYIERLAEYWGELCVTKELASSWADRLVGITRMALSPDPNLRGHFHGTSACLSALFRAERYGEIVELVAADRIIWPYKRWAVKALAAMGKKSEAVRYAESCRGPWTRMPAPPPWARSRAERPPVRRRARRPSWRCAGCRRSRPEHPRARAARSGRTRSGG